MDSVGTFHARGFASRQLPPPTCRCGYETKGWDSIRLQRSMRAAAPTNEISSRKSMARGQLSRCWKRARLHVTSCLQPICICSPVNNGAARYYKGVSQQWANSHPAPQSTQMNQGCPFCIIRRRPSTNLRFAFCPREKDFFCHLCSNSTSSLPIKNSAVVSTVTTARSGSNPWALWAVCTFCSKRMKTQVYQSGNFRHVKSG